ncbi:MAG: hypothetical protein EXS16_03435 [Gemmataceae bacterium]|nr:hypothetical protein [Gemmataceae bacterium]
MVTSDIRRSICVVVLFFTAITCAPAGGETKKTAPPTLVFKVTNVGDTDKIEAQFRDRKVTLRMANVIPFAKWPNDLTEKERKLKEVGLAFLALRLKDKEVVITGIDKVKSIHGDVVLRFSDSFTMGAPSTLGWLIVHLNCMLIEEGYSIYQKDPPELYFHDAKLGFKKQGREAIYKEAEAYAIKNKNGIWKHPELVKRLIALSQDSQGK